MARLCQCFYRSALTIGKSAPSPPPAPNPATTAAAQTASNQQTALYQFGLNNPNYNTPLGSLNYNVNTSNPNQPQTTANVTLSPEQQRLYNQQTQQSIGLSNLASELQGRVGSTLNNPLPTSADFNTAAQQASDAYYNQQKQYLDPQFQQEQDALAARNANMGITMNSEADNKDQLNFNNQKQRAYSDARQSAILNGVNNAQQLFSLNTAARNQPLNEFNALRSQSQVQMPQFNAQQPTGVAPTNTAQIAQQAYQNSLNPYNAQIAQNNQFNQSMGQLFGLGAQALFMSDIRLKENIHYIGHEKGHEIYSFNYISDPQKLPYRGVMAQRVMETRSDAVMSDGEYYMVDYTKLGIEFMRIH